ncbi:hypothetical protein OS175_12040 [Marinicella sp. S1101]|uniref:hypothetical protein n=1 Tax=Marinicella marina TaxID=2996016 RepID=UPI00226097FE|nr:hypothetical protein [Marinicella marina]MCX7554614.1 hypothetical protein [Marinicella marina]MDJ1140679.1 hypothetical protein [Marinicella marina]
MDWIHDIFRNIHVAGGFIGLFLYWIPILSKKGSPLHKKVGLFWVWLARVVLITAFLGVLLYVPKLIAADKYLFTHPNSYAFIMFLGYLSVVTYVVTVFAVSVLKYKADATQLATPFMQSMAYISILLSVWIIFYALAYQPDAKIVLLALSPVGLSTGWGMLQYMKGKHTSKRAWLYEHLGSMIGAGIAFHTAFAVFGMTRLFDIGLNGWVAVIPWILPAAIGIPASIIWRRHYQKKFNEIPA